MKYQCIFDCEGESHTTIVVAKSINEAMDKAEGAMRKRGIRHQAMVAISEKSSLFGTEKTVYQLFDQEK